MEQKKSNIYRLQCRQNNAARIISKKCKFDQINTVLRELHWFPLEHRIIYKYILLLPYRSLNGYAQKYIAVLISKYVPPWPLRPGDQYLPISPRLRLEPFGKRAFAKAVPCYVTISNRRILWRCRNLWLKVSHLVTGVAICDGKCRNLWQRQNIQLNGIYSINFDKYVAL